MCYEYYKGITKMHAVGIQGPNVNFTMINPWSNMLSQYNQIFFQSGKKGLKVVTEGWKELELAAYRWLFLLSGVYLLVFPEVMHS